jgi:hypothetical protein
MSGYLLDTNAISYISARSAVLEAKCAAAFQRIDLMELGDFRAEVALGLG